MLLQDAAGGGDHETPPAARRALSGFIISTQLTASIHHRLCCPANRLGQTRVATIESLQLTIDRHHGVAK